MLSWNSGWHLIRNNEVTGWNEVQTNDYSGKFFMRCKSGDYGAANGSITDDDISAKSCEPESKYWAVRTANPIHKPGIAHRPRRYQKYMLLEETYEK